MMSAVQQARNRRRVPGAISRSACTQWRCGAASNVGQRPCHGHANNDANYCGWPSNDPVCGRPQQPTELPSYRQMLCVDTAPLGTTPQNRVCLSVYRIWHVAASKSCDCSPCSSLVGSRRVDRCLPGRCRVLGCHELGRRAAWTAWPSWRSGPAAADYD